jgi:uncharacterized protein (TIGR03086 family)
VDELVSRHARACARFSAVADAADEAVWTAPTPCTEWDGRALVEHLIGFHEFLLLRPLGVRASRPRDDPAARWRATSDALFDCLEADGVIDRPTELPGGGQSSARQMLAALTTDVLVHTWDLARAAGVEAGLDPALCADAYAAAVTTDLHRNDGMIGPEIVVPADADIDARLVAFYGRDPAWRPLA